MNSARAALLASALLAGVVTFSTAGSAAGEVHSTAEWTPKAPPAIYDPNAGPKATRRNDALSGACTSDAQLDCVESVAAYLNGRWVNGAPTADADSNGDVWTIEGLVNEDGTNKVSTSHRLNYTGNIFLQFDIRAVGDYGDRYSNGVGIERNVKFRGTIRTSWVLPTHVKAGTTETRMTVERLATSGASRVTVEGMPMVGMVVLDDSTLTTETGKGAYDIRTFNFTVSDGRAYPIKKECIEKPTIMTSDNGYGIALPKFENGNLDLRLSSPHFRSDGTTVHTGVYEASIPLETAKCLWGESISTASQFAVEVIESNGETKTATRTVDVTSDAVSIKATNFTYSSPTIRVSYVAPVVPTTANPTTTTTTAAPRTNGVQSPFPTPPSKPTPVSAKGAKGAITISFGRVAGVTYSATALKGTTKKSLRCVSSSTKVTCTVKSLTRGSWKVTVTPRNSAGAGAAVTKSVNVG